MDESEKSKLSLFKKISLTKKQVEALLNRIITNNEYKTYLGKPIKKHKVSKAQKLRKKVDIFVRKYYKDITINKLKESLISDKNIKAKRESRYKEKFKSIAEEAAEHGKRFYIKSKITIKDNRI